MTTDTPRTDAIRHKYGMNSIIDAERLDYSNLSRQLERELASKTEELSDIECEVWPEIEKLKTEYWFMEEAMTKEIAAMHEELCEAGLRE